jgi:hypothetical protein
MKLAWLLLLMAPFARAAESSYLDAGDVLKTDGVLLICDNSSYFSFKADGVFRSFPRGASGRSLDGVWKKTNDNPLRVEVVAKVGWVNGSQPQGDDYRKIVFVIYGGSKRAVQRSDFAASQYKEVFEGYFILDELTKIAGPAK